MADEILRYARFTIPFERMAATELRSLADRAPDLADHLTKLADVLDEHADEAGTIRGLRLNSRCGPGETSRRRSAH